MKVFWTDRAKYRLKQIHQYIEVDSQSIANKTISRILTRSSQLSEVPFSGRKVPEYRDEKIREVLERPYRIIYRIIEDLDRVDVLAVMHYRQVLPEDLVVK